MHHRQRRRRQVMITGVAAIVFLVFLLVSYVLWPSHFAVILTVGATIGALTVLYEVRLTKRIAEAEFIRDLQTSFAGDPNIGELWKKILLKQEIGPQDRYAMSSYLTFFETLHLLHMRGALDFELTDELFRNRFFSAVGHPAVAGATLLKDPNSFTNITALMHDWTRYIMANDIPTPVGYPNYLTLTATSRGFEPVDLGPDDLADLLELQAATLTMLQGSPVLRENSAAMFTACLTDPDHHVLGWRKDGRLVAAAILYDGGTSAESIRRYTTSDPEALAASINLKLVITRDGFTRANLSRSLILQLEQIAVGRGKDEILATIHPQNAASRALFGSLGYRQIGKASTGYGTRLIYRRALTAATADRQRSQTPWPSLRS